MKYLKDINELKTAYVLPKELRISNLIYHATTLESFVGIIKDDLIYQTTVYDNGVSTSRNKFYNFTANTDDEHKYNNADIQLILDKDKLKHNYKIKAFDYEEMKSKRGKIGSYSDYHQSEDKIYSDIKNLHKYLIGFQISKKYGKIWNKIERRDYVEEIIPYLKNNTNFVDYSKNNNLIIFDEDWNDITNEIY